MYLSISRCEIAVGSRIVALGELDNEVLQWTQTNDFTS